MLSSSSSSLISRSSILWSLWTFLAVAVVIGTANETMTKPKIKLEETHIKSVVVVIAMEAEASPFIEHLNLEASEDFFPAQTPFKAFSGPHNDCHVTVVTNGKDHVHGTGVDNVGTIPAALLTFLTLQKVPEADLLVNAGTCGGFKAKGAEIGDVFLTTAVANHDRRIPIPGFAAYGTGRSESQIEDLADVAASVHAKLGVCTTGNSLDKHDWDEKHMLENDASIKDMEAAAIAWSCAMSNNTPFMGVKVVTDIVDGFRPTDEEFLENLSHAAKSLQSALPTIIDHVCSSNKDSKAEL